jgi:hypothetical protein
MGLAFAVMVIAGIALFVSAFSRLKLREAIEDTPTSKIRSAAMGKAELAGLGKNFERCLIAPFSAAPCLWHRWQVEEERSSSDARGNRTSYWETIEQGISSACFQIQDSSGEILINPQGAEVDAPKLFSFTQGGFLSLGAAPRTALYAQYAGGPFTGRRRFTEWRLDEGLPLTVLGVIRPSSEGGPVTMGQGRFGEPFFISLLSRQELEERIFWAILGRMLGGALLCLAGLGLAAHSFLGW